MRAERAAELLRTSAKDHWPCRAAEVGMRIGMAGDFVTGAMSSAIGCEVEQKDYWESLEACEHQESSSIIFATLATTT